MKYLIVGAMSASLILLPETAFANKNLTDEQFTQLTSAEQEDMVRKNFRMRIRLMGASEYQAQLLQNSIHADNFLNDRLAWRHLLAKYKIKENIPGGEQTSKLIRANEGKRIDYLAEPPTVTLIDNRSIPLEDLTEADVTALLKNSSPNVATDYIKGLRPDFAITPYQGADANLDLENFSIVLPETALIKPEIKNLVNPTNARPIAPVIQAVAYTEAISHLCKVEISDELRTNIPVQLEAQLIETGDIKAEKSTSSQTSHIIIGYRETLNSSGFMGKRNKAVKKKAKKICTKNVKDNLLTEIQKMGSGNFKDVVFLSPYF